MGDLSQLDKAGVVSIVCHLGTSDPQAPGILGRFLQTEVDVVGQRHVLRDQLRLNFFSRRIEVIPLPPNLAHRQRLMMIRLFRSHDLRYGRIMQGKIR